jgi:hypothetical protein
MIAAVLLTSYLASQAASARGPAFQPRLHVNFKLMPKLPEQGSLEREVVCGMVVVHKTADADPMILVPRRETGAVIRRIEPQACGAARAVRAK